MISFFLWLGLLYLTILVLELFVRPRPPGRGLHARRSLLLAAPVIIFYVTIFMVSYRPVFSFASSAIAYALIVTLNNAKYRSLKDPLVFSDFTLLRELIDHPQLYIPHIGGYKLIAAGVAFTSAVVLSTIYEAPVIIRGTFQAWLPTAIYVSTIVGLIYAITRGPLRPDFVRMLRGFGPKLKVEQDIAALSLIVCLTCYFFLAGEKNGQNGGARDRLKTAVPTPSPDAVSSLPAFRFPDPMPNIVIVQAESFFDARRLHSDIDRGVLSQYDRVAAEARFHGRLDVPAWGGNTMRTEFAFLSGLPNAALGYDRFNPYTNLAKRQTWSMAQMMRSLGYQCTCLHPFDGDFFGRKDVFSNLGFHQFLDIKHFNGCQRVGPYIGDMAVADKILKRLDDDNGPEFILAITMENHGSWGADRFCDDPGIIEGRVPPLGSIELRNYLVHIENTDKMVERLTTAFRDKSRPTIFCYYGDHVPNLSAVFNRMGYNDGRTDYFIWSSEGGESLELDTPVESLSRLILDAVFALNSEPPK